MVCFKIFVSRQKNNLISNNLIKIKIESGDNIKQYLIGQTKQTTVPNVFVNGEHVGGFDNTSKALAEGRLVKILAKGT